MQTFLSHPEATFYHVTNFKAWEQIKLEGLKSKGKFYVCRAGELPVLLAIALEQLPEIEKTEAIVFLKLPQSKNNFLVTEIGPDNQAKANIEWTQPFHNIIHRKHIPIENIELMKIIRLGQIDSMEREKFMVKLNKIANDGRVHCANHSIVELVYPSFLPDM